MSKNKIRGYIVIGVLLVLITVIAFAVPFCKTATFWFGYIFALIAIVSQAYIFTISFDKGNEVKSKFYGFPIARIGMIYLCIQIIMSLAEMVLAGILPTWISVVLNFVILGAALIGCIATDTVRDEIEKQDVVLKANVENMRSLQSLSKSLVNLSNDETLTKELKKLANAFSYSDPVSSEKTFNMEKDLENQLRNIQAMVVEGNADEAMKLCGKALIDLAERNRVCKLGK